MLIYEDNAPTSRKIWLDAYQGRNISRQPAKVGMPGFSLRMASRGKNLFRTGRNHAPDVGSVSQESTTTQTVRLERYGSAATAVAVWNPEGKKGRPILFSIETEVKGNNQRELFWKQRHSGNRKK